jgi:hypothetical protein
LLIVLKICINFSLIDRPSTHNTGIFSFFIFHFSFFIFHFSFFIFHFSFFIFHFSRGIYILDFQSISSFTSCLQCSYNQKLHCKVLSCDQSALLKKNPKTKKNPHKKQDSSDWKLNLSVFSSPAQLVGPFRGRSFCIQANTPTAQICQLETRSNGNLHGCIFRELERSSGVRLSPICPDRSLCTAGEVPESGSISSSSTGMANSALVPIAISTVCGSSTTISDVSSTSDEGRTVAPSMQSSISWVEAVGKSHETANVSEENRKFCWRPGDKTPVMPMPLPGVSGLAGVINEKLIHFQHL